MNWKLLSGVLPPPFFTGTGPTFPNHELFSVDDEQAKAIMHRLGVGLLLQRQFPTRDDETKAKIVMLVRTGSTGPFMELGEWMKARVRREPERVCCQPESSGR